MMPSCPKGSIQARLLSCRVGEGRGGGSYLPSWAKLSLTFCHIARIETQGTGIL